MVAEHAPAVISSALCEKNGGVQRACAAFSHVVEPEMLSDPQGKQLLRALNLIINIYAS